MFFSSSRRRHTSWPRDWSSDVCSSDLLRRMDKSEHECGKNNCLNRNGKAPEIFISAVHRSDIETGQPYRSAKWWQSADDDSRHRHLMESEVQNQKAGCHTERDDITERVEFGTKGAGGVGQPRDDSVQRVEHSRQNDEPGAQNEIVISHCHNREESTKEIHQCEKTRNNNARHRSEPPSVLSPTEFDHLPFLCRIFHG